MFWQGAKTEGHAEHIRGFCNAARTKKDKSVAKRRFRKRSIAFLIIATACGKQAPQASWRFGFENGASATRAVAIDSYILEGGCTSQLRVYEAEYVVGSSQSLPAPPTLAKGRYGFEGRARDATCLWYARGCQEVDLPSESQREVYVALVPNNLEEQKPGCLAMSDGGTPKDSSPSDGTTDVGTPTCDPAACEGKRCTGSPAACDYFPSCKALHADSFGASLPTGVYVLDADGAIGISPKFSAYCEMTSDGGGWTLALKANGSQAQFEYYNAMWTNNVTFGDSSLDLSLTAAKHKAFLYVKFGEVRIGMKTGSGSFIWATSQVTNVSNQTLLDVFSSDGNINFTTSFSRATWRSLVPGNSLQPNCNREGLNNSANDINVPDNYYDDASIRIGILGNGEDDCLTPDSWIGIGGYGMGRGTTFGCGGDVETTVGSVDTCIPSSSVTSWGIVLVR